MDDIALFIQKKLDKLLEKKDLLFFRDLNGFFGRWKPGGQRWNE